MNQITDGCFSAEGGGKLTAEPAPLETLHEAYLLIRREFAPQAARVKPILLAVAALGLAIALASCAPAPTPTPSECVDAQRGQLVNTDCERPGVQPDPTATPFPGGINVGGSGRGLSSGATVFLRVGGCGACHTNETAGATGNIGPNLSRVGAKLSADEIRQSIIQPEAVIAVDCPTGPCSTGVMPTTFGETLSAEQLNEVVEFLAGLK